MLTLVVQNKPFPETIEEAAFDFCPPTWEPLFEEAKDDIIHAAVTARAHCEKERLSMFPPPSLVFRAFYLTPLPAVRVVIVGQDPYYTKYINSHGESVPTATGLSFSVNEDCKVPPSLVNIYKELSRTIDGFEIPKHGNLTRWAEQGVLMLNMGLTVAEQIPESHIGCWMGFLDKLVVKISEYNPRCIYVLWGIKAGSIKKLLSKHAITKVVILESPHPAASCYGNAKSFVGNNHFKRINEILRERGERVIDWQV